MTMQFFSTKGEAPSLPVSQAMLMGAASDGGLYVPEHFPVFAPEDFGPAEDLPAIAQTLLRPFFAGDGLEQGLGQLCRQVFNFPASLVPLDDHKYVLELFHGPTAAFKDFGARFLAACLDRLASPARPLTVLVATSGDTGGAVGCAFARARAARVVILYPKGRVSAFQEHQLCCWPRRTVTSLRVDGDFDACQAIVKSAFANAAMKARFGLTSANSINIGRLLPQMVYYASSSVQVLRATGKNANYIIPTGNMGNATACLWARACGLPIGNILLTQNANRPVADYFAGGDFAPRPSQATIANAMDVGTPSNFERFLASQPLLHHGISALWADDAAIAAQIKQQARTTGRLWCPHSSTAAIGWEALDAQVKSTPQIIVATAHPYKFKNVIAPLTGQPVLPSPALAAIENRPVFVTDMPARLEALAKNLAQVLDPDAK